MLPILAVTGVPGLIYLNGMFCGETGQTALPLSRFGAQYLEVRPFRSSERGATMRLELDDGLLSGGLEENAFAVQWPDGRIELEIRPESGETAAAAPPALLDRLPVGGEDYLLVAESGVASFGRAAEEAVFLPVPEPREAALRALSAAGLVAACGACAQGRFAAVLRAQGAPEALCCRYGLSAEVDESGVLRCLEGVGDFAGHAFLCAYAPDENGLYRRAAREAAWENGCARRPDSPAQAARAYLEALLCGFTGEAAGYLLRPEDAAAFAEAAGAFDAVVELPPDGGAETALGALRAEGPRLARVRRLAYAAARDALGEWKLTGLAERPCFFAS